MRVMAGRRMQNADATSSRRCGNDLLQIQKLRSWDNGVQKLGDGEFLHKPLLCRNSDPFVQKVDPISDQRFPPRRS
jgi:hypothetical protein